MINFIQSNQNIFKITPDVKEDDISINFNIIDNDIWDDISNRLKQKESIEKISKHIFDISLKYNIDKKNFIKDYLNYIIRNNKIIITSNFLNFTENIMHSQDCNNQTYIYYSLSKLLTFF